ncbi:glycosyltransferase BC10-like isoform X2 [Vigna unguiculata]|uniref:glycosyltransferase BC10-like isoform X2 n=1 Tax=Vigna unguiculata TaxID=3917 RepID=UPI001016D684|nr:glycosyltransferase BC10-like isoform X2 [Vigna unguiculata]
MKKERAWPQFIRNLLIMVGSRSRPQLRRPTWIIVLVSIVCVFLIAAYVYPPRSPSSCSLFSSRGCGGSIIDLPPAAQSRQLTDAEVESRVVINEILNYYPVITKKPKVAFLFLTPSSLPFERLWHMFFKGHEGKFSVYVHASKDKPTHVSPYFIGRDIHSAPVGWGKISMVEAERRLLANALLDPDNQHFVLLSESCIPVRRFDFVYNYLLLTNVSFIDSYVDPGPHGNGRYIEYMLPEVEKKDFRKGSQPNMEGNRNCYADEHYLPTFFTMLDPGGIANWSVTYVDWSEGKWHPRSFRARDVTYQVMKNIAYIDESPHFTSDAKRTVVITPCVLNGSKRSCYLFARKFFPETQERLIQLYSNSTIF